jgi:signal peptidase I
LRRLVQERTNFSEDFNMNLFGKKQDSSATSQDSKKSPSKRQSQEGTRETVEAVAIAFILAFVFKTFEAEAFVIPTGSMAPTLYGRHKEVICEGCGLEYTVGASQEIDQESGVLNPEQRVSQSRCPNCRYRNEILSAPVFNGDRIVVNKQVLNYRRFDVVVFKNPEEPHVNYIKRLVGLPGETVRIRQGDIQTRKAESDPWDVQFKEDAERQRDIQLLVYDDNFPPRELLAAGVPERWSPAQFLETDKAVGGWPRTENAWTADSEKRTYTVDSSGKTPHWLRYRHLVPNAQVWYEVRSGTDEKSPVNAQLIADFCSFNDDDDEIYWVNDLTVEFNVTIDTVTADGQLTLELEEGLRTARCVINPESGTAEVTVFRRDRDESVPQEQESIATVQTGIQGTGSYEIAFANVDDRLCLWVDGDLIPLGEKAHLSHYDLNVPSYRDLAPVGIASSGLKATVSDLKIRRDIYYRNEILRVAEPGSPNGYMEKEVGNEGELVRNLDNPEKYGQNYESMLLEQEQRSGEHMLYVLADDEYLMFGDNSPKSKDSRLFDHYSRPARGVHSHRYAVREKDLIGEALCIFWPHGIPFMNDGKGYTVLDHKMVQGNNGRNQLVEVDYPLYSVPFYPNLSRMKRIR